MCEDELRTENSILRELESERVETKSSLHTIAQKIKILKECEERQSDASEIKS